MGNVYGTDDHAPKLTAVTGTVTAASGICYFNTRFADKGASLIVNGKQWSADVDPNAYMAEPTLEWDTPTQPETAGSADAQVTVQELVQNLTYTITFNKPLIGHTSTSMSSTHTAGLEGFVRDLLQDETAMRVAGNKVRFKIVSEWGNDRRTTRFNLVKSQLQKHFDAHKQEIAMHPGLDDNGNPRTGPVDVAWIKATRVDQITVTLPTGGTPTAPRPGDLVGPASATNCPINVEFTAVQHYSINGNSGSGSQIMVLKTDATACAETVCHELGHSMGMTIMAGKSAIPPGMDAAKHVDQAGGFYYVDGTPKTDGRRGIHKGGHCASGLADPSVTDYSSLKGTCIMWGAGGTGITRAAFCATCNTYLRARKLSDVRSAWSSRTAADY